MDDRVTLEKNSILKQSFHFWNEARDALDHHNTLDSAKDYFAQNDVKTSINNSKRFWEQKNKLSDSSNSMSPNSSSSRLQDNLEKLDEPEPEAVNRKYSSTYDFWTRKNSSPSFSSSQRTATSPSRFRETISYWKVQEAEAVKCKKEDESIINELRERRRKMIIERGQNESESSHPELEEIDNQIQEIEKRGEQWNEQITESLKKIEEAQEKGKDAICPWMPKTDNEEPKPNNDSDQPKIEDEPTHSKSPDFHNKKEYWLEKEKEALELQKEGELQAALVREKLKQIVEEESPLLEKLKKQLEEAESMKEKGTSILNDIEKSKALVDKTSGVTPLSERISRELEESHPTGKTQHNDPTDVIMIEECQSIESEGSEGIETIPNNNETSQNDTNEATPEQNSASVEQSEDTSAQPQGTATTEILEEPKVNLSEIHETTLIDKNIIQSEVTTSPIASPKPNEAEDSKVEPVSRSLDSNEEKPKEEEPKEKEEPEKDKNDNEKPKEEELREEEKPKEEEPEVEAKPMTITSVVIGIVMAPVYIPMAIVRSVFNIFRWRK